MYCSRTTTEKGAGVNSKATATGESTINEETTQVGNIEKVSMEAEKQQKKQN